MSEYTGADLIAMERQRQRDDEGYDDEHDDEHTGGDIAHAAAAYAWASTAKDIRHAYRLPPAQWPWEARAWKPSADPVRNLVKAGALIAAEIDRLQRARVLREGITK